MIISSAKIKCVLNLQREGYPITCVSFSTLYPFSARYGQWHKDKSKEMNQKNVPRIIVFVLGGATYSEFRVGYEVTNDRKNWEVIVGE